MKKLINVIVKAVAKAVIQTLMDMADEYAKSTETKVDDEIVAELKKFVAEKWG